MRTHTQMLFSTFSTLDSFYSNMNTCLVPVFVTNVEIKLVHSAGCCVGKVSTPMEIVPFLDLFGQANI